MQETNKYQNLIII